MKRIINHIAGFFLLIPVYIYRVFISPLSSPSCRHTPTCSEYAIDAVKNVGPVKGIYLATGRILRCRPGGTHGYDPAPVIWIKRYRPLKGYPGRSFRSNRLKDHK